MVFMEISIVMPSLFEAETIGTCRKESQASFEEGEIIVADNVLNFQF